MGNLHLVKLCVGVDSVEQLIEWRQKNLGGRAETASRHVTRMFPKRRDELLAGGSLYWVIKGEIQARQEILSLDEVTGQDGIRRCAIVMGPELIRTARVFKRPFQGWRYLKAADAPPDLAATRLGDDELPAELSQALADIGLL